MLVSASPPSPPPPANKQTSPNRATKDTASALHAAAQRGPVSILKLLLKHGANPNVSAPLRGGVKVKEMSKVGVWPTSLLASLTAALTHPPHPLLPKPN